MGCADDGPAVKAEVFDGKAHPRSGQNAEKVDIGPCGGHSGGKGRLKHLPGAPGVPSEGDLRPGNSPLREKEDVGAAEPKGHFGGHIPPVCHIPDAVRSEEAAHFLSSARHCRFTIPAGLKILNIGDNGNVRRFNLDDLQLSSGFIANLHRHGQPLRHDVGHIDEGLNEHFLFIKGVDL